MLPPVVHYGRAGFGLFQCVYARNALSMWAYCTLLEWHAVAALIALLGVFAPPLLLISAAMWMLTLIATARTTFQSQLPRKAPWWARPLVFMLHGLQPMVRSWYRHRGRLISRRLPAMPHDADAPRLRGRPKSFMQRDAYWESNDARGREHLLAAIEQETIRLKWAGRFDDEFASSDALLHGGWWCGVTIRTVTEELGYPRRFTRARVTVYLSKYSYVLGTALGLLAVDTAISRNLPAFIATAAAGAMLVLSAAVARARVLRRAFAVLAIAGHKSGLTPVTVGNATTSASTPAEAARAYEVAKVVGETEPLAG
jgi:hypothetical protein